MSDNMDDKNENIDETMVDETMVDEAVVDEAVVDKTAEAEASETVDDAAIGDIAADESSADSIESIDFTVVYDDDNAAVAGNDTADAAETADAANNAADATNDDSDVAANNANQVKETLALRSFDAPTALETHEAVKADSATSVSSQLDNEIKRNRKKDAFFFKANPTFALDHVTVTNRKTGRNILDDLSLSFHAGATHAVLVDAEDREQHQALLATMVGMVRTDRGNVMHKSANLSDVESAEMLGHRIGFIPQRFAFRPDLDAESNVLYAMDASNRNFLKPKPVIARELLKRMGFDEVTSGLAVGEASELNQRRVAIARALSCEAEVIIADEPTAGLDADDAAVVLDLLKKFKRDADRKRAIIVVTTNPEVADAMDHSVELD